jgi:hypothetical protein
MFGLQRCERIVAARIDVDDEARVAARRDGDVGAGLRPPALGDLALSARAVDATGRQRSDGMLRRAAAGRAATGAAPVHSNPPEG